MGIDEHYFIGRRNLKKEHHWESLDGVAWHIDKPTVICLGGNCSLKPLDANSLNKTVQRLSGIHAPIAANEIANTEDIDFVGIAYGTNNKVYDAYPYFDGNDGVGSLTHDEVKELAKKIFEPLYLDEKGCIRPTVQILKNFNLITFFAHCHGATEVRNLISCVAHQMSSSGVTDEIIDSAINQIFAISYAPMIRVNCPNLQVISEMDSTLLGGPMSSKISEKFLMDRFENGGVGSGTVAYKENEYTVTVITSNMTKNRHNEHPVCVLARDERWQMVEENLAYGDEVSQAMGVALSYCLANSLHNARSKDFVPKPSADFILQKVQSILGKTQNRDFANEIARIQSEQNNNLER